MTPYQEAQQRANEIALGKFAGMFVTISLGGEYINSYDVEATTVAKMTTEEKIAAIQKRLNELKVPNTPLKEDGIMGRVTLSAILEALKPK